MASRGVRGIDIQANLSLDISALISSLEKDLSAKTLGIEIKPSLANFDVIKKALAGLRGEIEIISPNQSALFANLLGQLIAVGDRLKSVTNFSPIFDNATASAKKLNQEITLLRDSLTSINRRKIEIISQKQSDAIAKALADIREIDSLIAKGIATPTPTKREATTEQPPTSKPSPVNEPTPQSIPQPPDIEPQLGLKQFEEISLAIKNLQESIKQIPSDEFLSASNRIDEEVTRLRAELEGIALSLPKGLGRKIGAQKAALTRISKQIDNRINIPPVPVDVKLEAPKIPDLDPIQVDSRIESVKAPKLESIAIDLKIEAPKIPDLDPIRVDSKVGNIQAPNLDAIQVDVKVDAPKVLDLDTIQVDSILENIQPPKIDPISVDIKLQDFKVPDLDPIVVDAKVNKIRAPDLEPVAIDLKVDAPKIPDLEPIEVESRINSVSVPTIEPVPIDVRVKDPNMPQLDTVLVDTNILDIEAPKISDIPIKITLDNPIIPNLDPIVVESRVDQVDISEIKPISIDVRVDTINLPKTETILVESTVKNISLPETEQIGINVKVEDISIPPTQTVLVESRVESVSIPTIEPVPIDARVENPKIPDLDPIQVDSNLGNIQVPSVDPIQVDVKINAPKIPNLDPIQVDSKIESVEVPKLDPVAIDIRLDTPKVFDLDPIQVDSRVESVQSPDLDPVLVDVKVDAPKVLDLDPIQVDSKVGSIEPPKVELIQVDVEVNDLDIPKPDPIFVDADIKSVDIPKVEPINIDLKIENVETPSTKTIPVDATVVNVEIPKVDPIFVDARVDRIEPPDIEPIALDLKIDPLNAPAIEPQIKEDIKSVDVATEKLFKDTAKQFDLYREIVNQVVKESNLSSIAKDFLGDVPKLAPLPASAPKKAAAQYSPNQNLILVRQELIDDIAQNIISPADIVVLVHELRHAIQSSFGNFTDADIKATNLISLLKPLQTELTQFQIDSILEGSAGSTELFVDQLKSAGINIESDQSKERIDFINQLEDDAYTFQALYTKKIIDSLKGVVPSLEKASPDFDRLKLAQSVSGLITEADLVINQAIGGVNKEIDRAKTEIKAVGKDLPRFAIQEVNKAVAGIGSVPEIGNVASRINKIGDAGSKVVGIFRQLKSAFKDSFSTFIALQLSNVFDNIFFALQDTARQIQTISTQFEGFANSINFVSGGLEQGVKNFNAIAKSAKDLKVALIPAIEGYTLLAAATAGTNLEKDTIGISQAILQAGRAYSITTDRLNNATLAIGQIAGKAVVSQEELRGQLSEALPGALQVASRAFGVTTAELNKLVEAGLTADEFLPKFARQLRRETAFAAEQGSKTLGAAVQNLANARDTLFVAIGQQASPTLIGLYDGLAVALNSVAGAIAPVVAGFVDLAKIGAGIAVIQGLSLGLTALTPALGFASLALKALILDLQALTFQSFTAGITSATAGILTLVKTAATSKIAIQGLSLGITALAGSILIGVVEAGLAVDDLNKKAKESADSITKFRDDLNRANAKPIELGVAKNLEQEFRDSQSVFIKLANLISVFQRLATGGDVIDNLNAVRSQKFFNTIDQGNAVLESSIKLRSDDARGIIVQAAAVELAGDQLARQLSIAKDSLAVTDAERQAKDNLVKQLEKEIEANRRLEDSLAGIDKAYGDVLRAINKRIAGSKRAEAEALAEVAKLEVQGTELQESLERRKSEATKNRISEELQAQQDLLKSLQSRQDATTNTKTIDEIEKVNKAITDLTKQQANDEIAVEKAKQAERIAIIEEASQKALSVSKEAEQERLIELQKLYNADLISKEKLELEKLKVTQDATDAQLASVEEEIKAVNSADIAQREKELKLRELKEKSGDLILQKLEQQKRLEEDLFETAKNRIEKLAKIQIDKIELESKKITRLLTVQEKSLERQLNLINKRNELLKARSDAFLFVSTAETDRLNRALEIVRKINSGDIGSQKELKALKQELSDLGIGGTIRERDLIEQIGKQEAKTRELKLKALETEQRIQSQILELEIQKTEQAQKRALIEAQAQVRTAQVELAKAPIEQTKTDLAAQKAVIESTKELAIAQKELAQASGDSEKKQAQEAIALAQRRLEIAQQELALSRDTTSTDLARERLGLAIENLREQEKISSDQSLINDYQRESLKLTQSQAKAQLEIENRTNRAANRTNRAIGEANRSQGFVSDPVVERRRQDEIDAIKAKGKLERESNADTQKAIAEARKRFSQEDIENREKAIKAQGAITVPVNLEPLPLTDLKRQIENAPPLDIPARLRIDNSGNLLDSQALNVPTIPQPQELGNRGQNGMAQLGLDILNQLKDLGLKIPNIRPEVNATFNNQFASTDQKELLRKARNQNLADIESVFANVVGAF
jgi:tape measure domain-containing protein